MSGKLQDYRIFVGGLSWDVTEPQLEDAFSPFGKIVDCQIQGNGSVPELKIVVLERAIEKITNCTLLLVACTLNCKPFGEVGFIFILMGSDDEICRTADSAAQVMLERDTGRPRGFGFLTFADRWAMEDAIREMDGAEVGDRVISVNKAQPNMGNEDPDHGFGGGYLSGGRASYGGANRSVGQDTCFSCGCLGHWARNCPLEGGGLGARPLTPPPRSRYGGERGDRFGSDWDRYMDEQYDRGNYDDREYYDSRNGSRVQYTSDRYPPSGDHFGNRYGGADHYRQNGYGKERGFVRDVGLRGAGDRYEAGGPA